MTTIIWAGDGGLFYSMKFHTAFMRWSVQLTEASRCFYKVRGMAEQPIDQLQNYRLGIGHWSLSLLWLFFQTITFSQQYRISGGGCGLIVNCCDKVWKANRWSLGTGYLWTRAQPYIQPQGEQMKLSNIPYRMRLTSYVSNSLVKNSSRCCNLCRFGPSRADGRKPPSGLSSSMASVKKKKQKRAPINTAIL